MNGDIKCECGNTFRGMIGKEDSCPECIRACVNPMKFGKCPHCGHVEYSRDFDETVTCYDIPYVIFNASCENCGRNWREYFSQDEVCFTDKDDNSHIYTNTIGDSDKKILLKAMNRLIDTEEDAVDYTQLIKKLNGELEKTE